MLVVAVSVGYLLDERPPDEPLEVATMAEEPAPAAARSGHAQATKSQTVTEEAKLWFYDDTLNAAGSGSPDRTFTHLAGQREPFVYPVQERNFEWPQVGLWDSPRVNEIDTPAHAEM